MEVRVLLIMHTNHRRKTPKHANERYLAPRSWHWTIGDDTKPGQKEYWRRDRRKVHELLRSGRWDDISTRPRNSVLWSLH